MTTRWMRVDFHSEHIVDYYAVTFTQFFFLPCSLLYLGSVRRVFSQKKLFYERRMHEITISYDIVIPFILLSLIFRYKWDCLKTIDSLIDKYIISCFINELELQFVVNNCDFLWTWNCFLCFLEFVVIVFSCACLFFWFIIFHFW